MMKMMMKNLHLKKQYQKENNLQQKVNHRVSTFAILLMMKNKFKIIHDKEAKVLFITNVYYNYPKSI